VAAPHEKRDSKLVFQLLDLLAERRLGDVNDLSRAPEIQFFGNGDEIFQMAQFHVRPGNLTIFGRESSLPATDRLDA
jgi:hypothetical protein